MSAQASSFGFAQDEAEGLARAEPAVGTDRGRPLISLFMLSEVEA